MFKHQICLEDYIEQADCTKVLFLNAETGKISNRN